MRFSAIPLIEVQCRVVFGLVVYGPSTSMALGIYILKKFRGGPINSFSTIHVSIRGFGMVPRGPTTYRYVIDSAELNSI